MFGREGLVVVFGFAVLAGVLTLWGGSVLYRALDGDRLTVRSRVRGRWTNSINWWLLGLALGVIGIGAIVGFATQSLGCSAPIRWAAASSVLAALGTVVLAWSWAGRRAAGKPRCPRCLYDVSAVKTDRCPECGFVASEEVHWYRPRKRRRGIVLGVAVLTLALAAAVLPLADGLPWRRLIPTSAMIRLVGILPDAVIGVNERSYGAPVHGTLVERTAIGALSPGEVERLKKRVEAGIREARSLHELERWLVLGEALPVLLNPNFDEIQARQFVESLLLDDAPLNVPYSALVHVDWSGLSVMGPEEGDRLADELVQKAKTSSNALMNNYRWLVATELASDPTRIAKQLVTRIAGDATASVDNSYAHLLWALRNRRPDLVAPQLWDAWLKTPNGKERQRLESLLDHAPLQPGQLDAASEERVWERLLEQTVRWVPIPEDAATLVRRLGSAPSLNAFLTPARMKPLLEHAAAGRLDAADIALLTLTDPPPGSGVPPEVLLDLAHNSDPLVRAAAVSALRRQMLFDPLSVREHEDAILLLEVDEITEPLIEDVKTRRIQHRVD